MFRACTRLLAGLGITLSVGVSAHGQVEPVTYTDENGTVITYNQNEVGASMTVQDARGVTTNFQANLLGLVTSEQSAERGLTQYTYDDAGNVIRQVSEGGLIFKRDYDDENRLTKEVMKQNGVDRKVNRYTYDNCANGEGLLCKVVSNGHITKYTYTLDSSIASVSTRYSGEDEFETTRYSYDSNGRATKLHYPTGLTVRYHYSDDNYVTKVTGRYETGEDRETFVIAKNLKFNPESQRLTGLTYGNGLKTKFNYSADNKLKSIKTRNDGALIDSASYTRNDLDQITDITRLNAQDTVQYGYDGFGRLISEQRGVDAATQSAISYNYDPVGNRLAYDTPSKQKSYIYGPQANRLDEINRKTLSYDVRGNLISDRRGQRSFAYDVTNRMTEFHKNDELRASYDYNAFGQRIRKTLHRPQRGDDSYRSLHFSYAPDGWLLSEFGKDSDRKRTFARDYVWLGAKPLAQIERKMRPDGTTRKAKISYLHIDHLNTPRWASDNTGQAVWRWESDGFGKGSADRDVDGDGQKTVIRLRFAGQYHDRESGLYYNHHRDYDPNLGRYIQSDPIGLKGGINRYAYVDGNPISKIDPNGLRAILMYSCVTTALSDGNGGWVPGSNITKCSPYYMETPEYDEIGDLVSEVSQGGGGSIFSQLPSLDDIEEFIDKIIKDVSCALLTRKYLQNLELLNFGRIGLSAAGLDPNQGIFYAQLGVDGVIAGGLGGDAGVYFRADGSDYGFFSSLSLNTGFDIDAGGAILYTTSNDLTGLSNVHEAGAYFVDVFGTLPDTTEDGEFHIGFGASVSPLPGGLNFEALSYTATTSCTQG